jgi:uncharacterized protein (TIGR00251 family)
VSLAVWAMPGARQTELAGVSGGRLRVRLHAPAQEGRANAELIGVVARLLGVSRSDVRVAAGAGGRHKLLHIRGVTIDEARRDLRL